MRALSGVILLFPLIICAGSLRITDSSRTGSEMLRRAALNYAEAGKKSIRIDRMSSKAAESIIPQKMVDIAVFEAGSVPAHLRKNRSLFLESEALLICVNAASELENLSLRQVKELFSAPRPRWSSIGGGNRSIHRFKLDKTAAEAGFDTYILGVPASGEVRGFSTSKEIALMVAANADAMGFCGVMEKLRNIKFISVDGVYPSAENIRNGSYQLSAKYVAVAVKNTPETNAFFDYLCMRIAE